MKKFVIKPVYARFFWPHVYAREAGRMWVRLVVGYEYFVDGAPFERFGKNMFGPSKDTLAGVSSRYVPAAFKP